MLSSGLLIALLHFISLADLFTQTPSQILWEASNTVYSQYLFTQLSELEQCRVNKHPKDLTAQQRIRIRVLLFESPKLYP